MTVDQIELPSGRTFDTAPPFCSSLESSRFTQAGNADLEDHLAEVCREFLLGVQKRLPPGSLEAVLLTGSYARGEGSVVETEFADLPGEDLQFCVFWHGEDWGKASQHRRTLRQLANDLAAAAGVGINCRLLSFAGLRLSPISLFSYHLITSHRWVLGSDILLTGCAHHRRASHIPLAEGARLLLDSCAGLLFAMEKLRDPSVTPQDLEQIEGDLVKAELAFGDTVLLGQGQYHWNCHERHRRLEELATHELPEWISDVRHHYADAVEFRALRRPALATRTLLQARVEALSSLGRIVWLWLEAKRLELPFTSARAYAFSRANKWPVRDLWRNPWRNIRTFGLTVLGTVRAFSHPRQRMLHALALLLWVPSATEDAWLLRRLQSELHTKSTTPTDLIGAFHALWHQWQ